MSDTLTIQPYSGTTDSLPVVTIGSAGYSVGRDWSFGALALSGGLIERHAPRSVEFDVEIQGTSQTNTLVLSEALQLALTRVWFDIVWDRGDGLPMLFSCTDAQCAVVWDSRDLSNSGRTVRVSFTMDAYGRSTSALTASGITNSGTGWMALAPTGIVGSAPGLVSEIEVSGTALSNTILHNTPAGKNANPPTAFTNTVDTVSHTECNTAPVLFDQDGTFALIVNGTWALGGGATYNTVTVTVQEFVGPFPDETGRYVFTQTVARADVGTSGILPLGFVSLPLGDSLGGPRQYVVSLVIDEPTGALPAYKPKDLLVLNVEGTTITQRNSGLAGTQRVYVLEPSRPGLGNRVVFSTGTSSADYRSRTLPPNVLLNKSGPVLTVHPAGSVFLVYARGNTPTISLTYRPRWLSERTV